MRFKRSVLLSLDCFSDVLKLFVYRLITGAVFFSLIYLILRLGLSVLFESAEFATLKGLITDFVRTFFTAVMEEDAGALTEFQTASHEAVAGFMGLIRANLGAIIGSVIGVCLIYLLHRYVNGLALFAVGSVVNDRMSTHSHTRFAAAYTRNLARSALYNLMYIPLAFVYDLLSALACWFLFFYIPSLLPTWGVLSVFAALSLTVTAMVLLQALKLTFISAWMPAMLTGGKGVLSACRESFRLRGSIARRFGGYLVACYLIVVVNAATAVFTAGSGLLLTVPASFLFLLAMQFVNYYESAGMKYYVSQDAIAEPEEQKP